MRKLLFLAFLASAFTGRSQYNICGGQTLNLCAPVVTCAPNAISYTLLPGNITSTNPCFTVTPAQSTNYTFIIQNANTTCSAIAQVTVNPMPVANPQFTQLTCNTTTNAFNMNITFNPTVGAIQTVTWAPDATNIAPIPGGWVAPQTAMCCSVTPGSFTMLVTASGGCSLAIPFTITPKPLPATFSFAPATGGVYSITCYQPTIEVSVSNQTLNYQWSSANTGAFSATSTILSGTSSANWSVLATNPTSSCTSLQTFTTAINVATPQAVINPTYQVITCANPNPITVTLTAISPTVNIEHVVHAPDSTIFVSNTPTAPYPPGTGVFTYNIINLSNGCFATKYFTVEPQGGGFPTYTIGTIPGGYTLGCLSKSCNQFKFFGSQTSPPGGSLEYALLTPNSPTGVPVPYNQTTTYTLCTAGNYTAYVKSVSNQCYLQTPFSILANTNVPIISAVVVPRQILTCDSTKTILTGLADLESNLVNWKWSFNGLPGTLLGNTIQVTMNPTLAPSPSPINIYTVTLQENNNQCSSTATVPMFQNIYPPKAAITTGGTNSLTCTTPTVMLNNNSSTGIPKNTPPFPNPSNNVVGFLWEGPTPQDPVTGSSTYTAATVGDYTLTAKDLDNGCLAKATASISDNRYYPLVNQNSTSTPSVPILDCNGKDAGFSPVISNTVTPPTYTWMYAASVVPQPTATNTWTNQILRVNEVMITVNQKSVNANKDTVSYMMRVPIIYTVVVTNTVNGCVGSATMAGFDGTLVADIAIENQEGWAPHTTGFVNNSQSSDPTTGTKSIQTVWSLGNGTSTLTSKDVSITPTAVYPVPGIYTVTAFMGKGTCTAVVTKTINVEIPSFLQIPNIFTPNNDGVNDLYFVRGTNLSEIVMKIYDRWGHLVYDVTTAKGLIGWDGKNQAGDEVADGTYYYVISAKRKDQKEDINEKGTITLVR
jgi:gliding motility-associated-like protein